MEAAGDHWVVQAPLAGDGRIVVTLILDQPDSPLTEVDLAIPEAEALLVLTDVWGDPVDAPPIQDGRRVHRWTGSPWDAELHALGDGLGVLRFVPHVTPE